MSGVYMYGPFKCTKMRFVHRRYSTISNKGSMSVKQWFHQSTSFRRKSGKYWV